MPAEQAAHAARVEMGSANAVKHHIRSATWESRMEIFLRDLKHCARGLLRSPGFTLIAVLSLALGIGANTAIFTLIKQVLLQNLPVRDPQQLVTFGKSTGGGVLGGIDLGTADMFAYNFARQLEANPGPFQGVAAYASFAPRVSLRISNSSAALQIPASPVSGNFFNVLGAAPFMGRTIAPFDAVTAHSNAVAVVSYHFWQQTLSSDPAVIGKTISINATPFTVVGVMPEAFHGITQELEPPDIWVPITMVQEILLQPGFLEPRSFYFLHMVARRSSQSPLATDQAWLDHQVRDYVRAGEGASIAPARQQEIERITVRLVSAAHGVSRLRSRYGDSLKILMAIVAVVLLIACANLANFLLARAIARQREVATRLALGSSRGRIIRQSLLEALLLSFSGGVFGLVLAFAATRTLIAFVAQGTANTPLDARPDSAVLLFTLAVSVLAGLLFGLAPALHGSSSSAMPALSANTRTAASAGGRASRWWPKALVTAQIMFCNQQVSAFEAEILILKVAQRAKKQSGSHQQQKAKHDLRGNQRFGPPAAGTSTAACGGPGSGVHGRHRRGASHVQCRGQTEEQTCQDRHAEREQKDRRVRRGIERNIRCAPRNKGDESTRGGKSQTKSEQAA